MVTSLLFLVFTQINSDDSTTSIDPATTPPPAAVELFSIPAAEERYAAEVSKAAAQVTKAKKLAAEVRLKAYRDELTKFTKAGDFDRAIKVKERIKLIESESDAYSSGSILQHPKDVVKFGGHTYAIIKDPATWHVAKRRCEEMGGRLACLGSEKEKIFAIDLCKSKSVKNCWVGATDEDDEGHWKWVDGSNVRVSGKNIDNELGAEHYLVIHVPLNDLTDSLSIRTPYLCEWDH